VKLSVKLITALAAFVLLVVGLVGLTSSGSEAKAANTAGKVYVANEWSKISNDPSAPTGYTSTTGTVYSTFVEVNASSTAAQSTIQTNADRVTIFVEDADQNYTLPKSETVTNVGDFTGAGKTVTVVLSTADSPIVDTGTGGITDGVDITITGTEKTRVALSNAVAGSKTSPGTITLVQTGSTAPSGGAGAVILNWRTSIQDTVQVKVTTTQSTTLKFRTLTETTASSGVFKGYIDLEDIQEATISADAKGIQSGGVVTVAYDDLNSDGTQAAGADKTTTATAETGAPLVTLTAPANGSSTQLRNPTFAGSVSDSTSALDISEIQLFVDQSNDATNTSPVVSTKGTTGTALVVPVGTADGASSTTFTKTLSDVPTGFSASEKPDHIVDWQVRASDLAGNIGWSDSSTTKTNTANRGQPNTVKVDQIIPSVTAAYTGFALDKTKSPVVRKFNVKNSVEVNFNDDLDTTSVANTDFEVVVTTGGSSVTQVPTTAEVGGTGFKDRVFLTLGTALATKDAPKIKVVGSITDVAGNTAVAIADTTSKDAIAPTITVALSGGSSATAPATLTKSGMTITITSDENLSSDPTVAIYNEAASTTSAGAAEPSVTAVNQGSNTWIATFSGGSYDGTTADGKVKSVVVTANDAATLIAVSSKVGGDTSVGSTVIGQTAKGKANSKASGAVTFTLDKVAPTLTLSPTGTTSDNSPFVRWNFGEKVTVTKAEFGLSSATLADVTSELGTSDSKTFIRATSALALGTYKATGTATDLAGNTATGLSATFVIAKRAEFKLTLLPGTTLVSFPLTPSDTSINAVFSPDGIVSVSSYDATAGTFSNAVRDSESNDLAGNLSSIESGVGYIVVADAVSALVVAIPSLTASSIPPSIDLVAGWNLVGATDVTGGSGGALQQPGSTIKAGVNYFPSKVTQVYTWDATDKVWEQLETRSTTAPKKGPNVVTGEAYWAFASAADVIVP
jgi:hypothetical protein